MVEYVTLSYGNGSVTVAKYSRIKVYNQFLGSIRGFIVSDDDTTLTLIVPDDIDSFDKGIIKGKEKSFKKEHLKGFAFYPEVTRFETRDSQGDV